MQWVHEMEKISSNGTLFYAAHFSSYAAGKTWLLFSFTFIEFVSVKYYSLKYTLIRKVICAIITHLSVDIIPLI